MDFYAFSGEFFVQPFNNFRIYSRQNPRQHFDNRYLASEIPIHGGKLDANDATPENDHGFRNFVQSKRRRAINDARELRSGEVRECRR